MFARLEYDLVDYHNASSECSTANQRGPDVGVVGTDDEMNGLIDFVRGQDYFDYFYFYFDFFIFFYNIFVIK